MLTIEDQTMLDRFERAEIEEPSPRKLVDESRTVYRSRRFPKPKNSKYGLPVLCDFGEARIGKTQKSGPHVQPNIYRAPEVIFEMSWGPAIDIWNLAGLVRTRRLAPLNQENSFSLSVRFGTSLRERIYSDRSSTAKVTTIRSDILHRWSA